MAFLKNILFSKQFAEKHRNSPTAFTRNRKLPFHLLVCLLINFFRSSYQTELDRFFQTINRSAIPERIVSKAAFSKARMKLDYRAFIELNQSLVIEYQNTFEPLTWQGFRLLAIDGTTLTLPDTTDIINHFGVWKGRQGDPCPKARASQLYDISNRLTLSAVITPKSVGERQQARHLLTDLPFRALILLDRGYPAFWLFKLILSRQAHFCARISCRWKIVRKFARSNRKEKVVLLKPGTAAGDCKELGLDLKPIKLRLIRVELDSGEIEILITSLVDQQVCPHEIFGELYHERWPVEEDYKTIKSRMEVEAFSGQSVLSVYQDFHARIFAKNLTAVVSLPAREALRTAGVKQKHTHQLNFTNVLAKARHFLVLLFQRTEQTIRGLILKFVDSILKTTEPVRPDRKYPRKHRSGKRRYYQNYKPIA